MDRDRLANFRQRTPLRYFWFERSFPRTGSQKLVLKIRNRCLALASPQGRNDRH